MSLPTTEPLLKQLVRLEITSNNASEGSSTEHQPATDLSNSDRTNTPMRAPYKLDSGSLSAKFIEDVTLPDGAMLESRKGYLKIWKVMNDGCTAWPEGTVLEPVPSNGQFKTSTLKLPRVERGEVVDIPIFIKTPGRQGHYRISFMLQTPDHLGFGDTLWIDAIITATPFDTFIVYPTLKTSVSEISDGSAVLTMRTPTIHALGEAADDDEVYGSVVSSFDLARRQSCASEGSIVSGKPCDGLSGRSSRASDYVLIDERKEGKHEKSSEPADASLGAVPSAHNIATDLPSSSSAAVQSATTVGSGPFASSTVYPQQQQQQSTVEQTPPIVRLPRTPSRLQQPIHPFEAQLRQIHEMGLTFCDELAISYLAKYQGDIDRAVPEMLEHIYDK
ncbi:hypothetical protein BX666DRAFT_761109 [Dichotomocladium elegans]|nr:hypothetical protein BX666DRAFT_761109 [Dichotomocladium elegans]